MMVGASKLVILASSPSLLSLFLVLQGKRHRDKLANKLRNSERKTSTCAARATTTLPLNWATGTLKPVNLGAQNHRLRPSNQREFQAEPRPFSWSRAQMCQQTECCLAEILLGSLGLGFEVWVWVRVQVNGSEQRLAIVIGSLLVLVI